jgi:membrane protease YdiL (CAAX protease family)
MPPLAAATPSLAEAVWILLLVSSFLAWVWALRRLTRGRPLLPEPVPVRAPWGAGSVLAAVLLYLAVSTLVSAAHSGYTGRRGLPDDRPRAPAATDTPPNWTPKDLLVMTSMVQGSLIVLLPLLLRATSGATLADLGFETREVGRNVRRGLVACALVAPGCYLLMALLTQVWPGQEHPLVIMLRRELDASVLALAIVSGVILAPVFEELVFRGILLGWMVRAVEDPPAKPKPAPLGPDEASPPPEAPRAVAPGLRRPPPATDTRYRLLPDVTSSALFALLHKGQWPAPIPLFFLALVLASLARRTGSLWASITLHASFNALSTTLLILSLLAGEPSREQRAIPPPASQLAPPDGSRVEDSENRVGFLLGGGPNVN